MRLRGKQSFVSVFTVPAGEALLFGGMLVSDGLAVFFKALLLLAVAQAGDFGKHRRDFREDIAAYLETGILDYLRNGETTHESKK